MREFEQSYLAGAFHPSLPKGRSSGQLRVSANAIHFKSENGAVDLPFDGMQIKRGGASNRLLYFENSRLPEWSLYTSDQAIIKHPLLYRRSHIIAQIQSIRRQRLIAKLTVLGVVIIVLLGIAGLFALREPIVSVVARQVPPDWEAAFSEKVFPQIVAGRRLIDDDKLNGELETITTPLFKAIPGNRYDFKIHIIEDSAVNAFAMPGGLIGIHTGLILTADSPEELAGVLAHEVSHVTHQHTFRSIISGAGLLILVKALFGDMTGILAIIADNGQFLLNRSYSRHYERDADKTGLAYLLAAAINPKGSLTIIQKLKTIEERRLEGTGMEKIPGRLTLLSTHPATDERIHYIQERLSALPPDSRYRSYGIDFAVLKDYVRSLLSDHKTENEVKHNYENGN
jgi:beta-barrel assembly-enhancing protease